MRDYPPYTIQQVISRLPNERVPLLTPPKYSPGGNTDPRGGQSHSSTSHITSSVSSLEESVSSSGFSVASSVSIPPIPVRPQSCCIGLAVEDMKNHMSQEGWEIFLALQYAGWRLAGKNLGINETDVVKIVDKTNPKTLLIQDKREWDTHTKDFRDKTARFYNSSYLSSREDIFRLTILKDAHARPPYHREAAEEIGCNAWAVYYNPRIVAHVATYIRPQHIIRTWHTINPEWVPPYTPVGRSKCLISGAISGAYPLRSRLFKERSRIPELDILSHPGYHRNGTATPSYLWKLARYKVAICTASVFGYALRKLIEATACGCRVITDLPIDEVMPEIDGNFIRVHPEISTNEMYHVVNDCIQTYDPERQEYYAGRATSWYDYREMGLRLSDDIEQMRLSY